MPPETLQARFPLSPKKFTKKMLQKALGGLFFSIVIGTVVAVMGFAISSSTDVFGIFAEALAAALVCFILFILIYSAYVKAYIRRYYYDANDSYVTIKKKVFAPAEIHVQFSKIQDVYVDQDILDRILGLYDVHLASATAASAMEAHIDGVEKEAADGLKALLLGKLQNPGSGGTPGPSGTDPVPLEASMPQPAAIPGDVSSATYPIVGRWIGLQFFTQFFYALFIAAVILFYTGTPGRDSTQSLLALLGVDMGGAFGIGVVIFVVVYAFCVIYRILWRGAYSFAFLSEYVVLKKGIIARSEMHLPYRSIQDVSVSQGVLERLFGLATVRIENAAQGGSPAAASPFGRRLSSNAFLIPGQPLDKANALSDIIKNIALTKNASQTGL